MEYLNNTSFFSIIIPVYNIAPYLRSCLDSVLNQVFIDYECILIDDGSTDESPNICDNYSLKDDRIKVIHKKNGGLSDARNAGILKSSGEYIIFLDGDDILSSNNALLNLNNIIKKTNVNVVFNSILTTFNDSENKSTDQFYGNDDCYNPVEFYKFIMNNDTVILASWLFIVQREFIIKNNLFFKCGIFHEDELWMPFVICFADRIAINHNPFYSYRKNRDNSIMFELNPKRIMDRQSIIDELLVNKEKIPVELQFIIIERCINLWHSALDDVFFLKKQYINENKIIFKKLRNQKYILLKRRKIKDSIYFFLVLFLGIRYTHYFRELTRKIFRNK